MIFPAAGTSSYFDRVPIGGHYTGDVRSIVNSSSYPKKQFDMEAQIHELEQEAYRSVLRAFKAQSDAISWEKEGLITELRKELRVSDDEHRELLTKVNADDIICKIREWRKSKAHMHELRPGPTFSAPWKKQKTSQSVPLAFSTPIQPSFGAGGRKPNSGQQVPGLSSMMSTRHPCTGPTPRGPLSNNYGSSGIMLTNDHSEAARHDPLIGRKVMTKWPTDNNFYEATIYDYNPQEDRHVLVYDKDTPNEAWEWVNLKEIPAEEIRWVGEDPGLSHQRGLRKQASGDENRISHGLSHRSVLNKASDDIEILHTNTLIKEVQKVLNASHPNLLEIEKAKKMLKDHEQALMDVISRLADASDGENVNKYTFFT